MGELTAEDKMSRSIIKLQKPQPFFAYLLMMLKPQEMPPDAPMQTMGISNEGDLFYAKEWVEKLTMPQTTWCMCHEVLHVALLHPLRMGTRIQPIANTAMDVVVNMMVEKTAQAMRGYNYNGTKDDYIEMEKPDGVVQVDVHNDSSSFVIAKTHINIEKVSEKTWEEVYSEIIEQLQKNGKDPNGADRAGGFDSHDMPGSGGKDGKQLSPQEQRELEQKWRNALAEAANYAKQQGKLPGGMDRIIDDILKPKVAWKQLLLQYLRPHINPVDWSYQKPHRKSQVLEVYMPNVKRERCEVEVIVDTSGSVSRQELKEFISEIVGIAQAMQHVRMWVTFVDAAVHTRYEVDNGDIPKIMAMEPKGGGGTDMEEGLDNIKRKNREIPVAVVLTDGYTSFNRKAKDYPFNVIWVITKNGISGKVPYGSTIKMDG